jgi:hypothetical protein
MALALDVTLILNISLVIVLIFLLKKLFPWIFNPLTPVNVDGHVYLVLDKHDKQQAAMKLAGLRKKLLNIADHTGSEHLKRKFKAVLSENAPGGSYTSYTVNKGDHIYMCMRNEDSLVDDNTLMFVAIHELAHVMTKSIGHQSDFKHNFKYLLNIAEKLNYYKPTSYHINPQPYCGTRISSEP